MAEQVFDMMGAAVFVKPWAETGAFFAEVRVGSKHGNVDGGARSDLFDTDDASLEDRVAIGRVGPCASRADVIQVAIVQGARWLDEHPSFQFA